MLRVFAKCNLRIASTQSHHMSHRKMQHISLHIIRNAAICHTLLRGPGNNKLRQSADIRSCARHPALMMIAICLETRTRIGLATHICASSENALPTSTDRAAAVVAPEQ